MHDICCVKYARFGSAASLVCDQSEGILLERNARRSQTPRKAGRVKKLVLGGQWLSGLFPLLRSGSRGRGV